MKKGSKIVSLLLCMLMVLSIAACGAQTGTSGSSDLSSGASGSGSTTTGVSSSPYDVNNMKFDKVVIKVSSKYGGTNKNDEYYRSRVEQFNALNNGITVEMDNISTESDYLDKLATAFADGSTPNVFVEFGGSRCLDYVKADALVDMAPYLAYDKTWSDSIMNGIWGATQYDGIKGTWGIPFHLYQVCLFYNKEILSQNNIEPPVTFDELLQDCATLMAKGIYPFQVGESDIYRWGHLFNCLALKTYGADVTDRLADRSLKYDSPEMIALYQIIKDMFDKGYLGPNPLSTNAAAEDSLFLDEKAAFKYDGTWFISAAMNSDIYDKIGVVAFPTINEEYAHVNQGGADMIWYISKLKKSEAEIAASVVFVKYMAGSDFAAGHVKVAPDTFPFTYELSGEAANSRLLNKVQALMNTTTDYRTDLQTYDTASHMINTVRNALQGLGLGNSAEQCGKEIVDRIAEDE
ncbi:MAG: extracellular solute-binding protein [Clostridiaceae bacterium]|nr:extracellular solute-binding protein [Clostridiaceae bacterium]